MLCKTLNTLNDLKIFRMKIILYITLCGTYALQNTKISVWRLAESL